MPMLEVCVDTMQSAVNAVAGGADRLEICCSLREGGLTPSMGFVSCIQEELNIPIHVLIRPRPGDFNYSNREICIMEKDINMFVELGVDGFVIGALDGTEVNKTVCQQLVKAAADVPVTFNRAFDLCTDHMKALNDVIELGCSRLLTSGFAKSAYEGRVEIKNLISKANSRLIVMPGCGIKSNNLKELIEYTEAQEYHSSARGSICYPAIETNVPVVEGTTNFPVTSELEVKAMKNILSTLLL